MPDPQDSLEINGRRVAGGVPAARPPRKFLSVWFHCCHTYGRLYRNAEATRYEGRCPKCGDRVHALIGPGGTTRRVFEAR